MEEVILSGLPKKKLLDKKTRFFIKPHRPLRHRAGPDGRDSASPPANHRRHLRGQWAATAAGAFLRQGPRRSTSKVGSLAAYMGRYIASKTSWPPAWAERCCEVQVAYAIGVARAPSASWVDTFAAPARSPR
jgi:S-adenosylmethionine synthetase